MSWPAPTEADRRPRPNGPVWRYYQPIRDFFVHPSNPTLDHWYTVEPGGWQMILPVPHAGVRLNTWEQVDVASDGEAPREE